jgi:hypothetical protein
MTKIAPAANDKAIDSILGSVYDDTVKPIAEETVPTVTASIHKKKYRSFTSPTRPHTF